MHAMIWMNPEHITLSERSHHNLILHEAIHMKCPVRQICSDRSVGRHEKRKEKGMEFVWGIMKMLPLLEIFISHPYRKESIGLPTEPKCWGSYPAGMLTLWLWVNSLTSPVR